MNSEYQTPHPDPPLCIVTVSVLWFFFTGPLVGLQCVTVVFHDHTHLLFLDEYSLYVYCQTLLVGTVQKLTIKFLMASSFQMSSVKLFWLAQSTVPKYNP